MLTARNALIGDLSCDDQACSSLEDLREHLSKSEIKSLAEDRTAELATATGNLSYQATSV